MEGYAFKRFNQLMAVVMRISCIEDRRYYYCLLERAKREHILADSVDSSGQQCFVLNSPEVRRRILAYEEDEAHRERESL